MIRKRSVDGPCYSSAADLEYVEYSLVFILMILGYTDLDVDNHSIDEVLATIKQNFLYDLTKQRTAAFSMVGTINSYLCEVYRTAWYNRQFVKGLIDAENT
jgi:hypothetical protein